MTKPQNPELIRDYKVFQHLAGINAVGAHSASARTRPVAAWPDGVPLQTDAVARRSFAVGAAWLRAYYFLVADRSVVAARAVEDCGADVAGCVAFVFDPGHHAFDHHAAADYDCLHLCYAAHYCVFARVLGVAGAVLQREDWPVAQSCLL